MTDHIVKLVSSEDGDWEQLFIDGELVEENHSLAAWLVLEALAAKLNFEYVEETKVFDD